VRKNKMHPDNLPEGYMIRPAAWGDLQAVTDVIIMNDLVESGQSDFSAEELEEAWKAKNFDLQQDAWVAVAPGAEAQIAGYEELRERQAGLVYQGDGYVHTQHCGLGIGKALLRRMEMRARAWSLAARQENRSTAPQQPVSLRNGVSGANQAAIALHQAEGYQPLRYYWRMQIELVSPPPAPAFPPGISLRSFVPGVDDARVFEAVNEAFRDHWGYTEWVFEEWRSRMMGLGYEPGLWFLAEEDGHIAGAALCRYRQHLGWVHQLAVRRPWRRRGLGLALLYQAFSEFYRRGTKTVGLGVDASNPTGATRLYDRAGMHRAHEYIIFEKLLNLELE
jgi:mycothiol synthase